MDVENILQVLEAHGLVRLNKISGDWYTMYCPFHSEGKERRPSFGVLLYEQFKGGQRYPAGFAHCFTCGYAKGLVDFVTDLLKTKSISKGGEDWLKEHIPDFEGVSDFEFLVPNALMNTLQDKYAVAYMQEKMNAETEYVSEAELASYRYTVPYMYIRKMNDWAIEKYDIGFDPNHIPPGRKSPLPCITFPVRNREGKTLFLCRRSIEGKYFNYPQGVLKPLYGIYELNPDARTILICESCINAITASIFGYNAVALLGTGNSYQINQLKSLGAYEYVICLDGDAAGSKGTAKLKKALSDIAIVWTIKMPDRKDVNDCTKEEFDLLYKLRE